LLSALVVLSAASELSEILGDFTLPTDKLIRTLGIWQAEQRQYDKLPAEVQDVLKA